MSWMQTNSSQSCATCANWAGARTTSIGKSAVTENPGVRGKCYAGVGTVIEGPRACDGHSCNKYSLWPAIK